MMIRISNNVMENIGLKSRGRIDFIGSPITVNTCRRTDPQNEGMHRTS